MTPLLRGSSVALIQMALLLGIAGTYQVERIHDPHVFIETTPVDPNLPIRGRYLTLSAKVEMSAKQEVEQGVPIKVRLQSVNARLVATPDQQGDIMVLAMPCGQTRCYRLAEPLAYFIAEHAPDPSRSNQSLWVEASLPAHGMPRPISLATQDASGAFKRL